MRIVTLVCYLISLTGVAATPAPTKVAILFFDGVQVIDFAAPFEVFNQAKYEVFSVSKDGHAVIPVPLNI